MKSDYRADRLTGMVDLRYGGVADTRDFWQVARPVHNRMVMECNATHIVHDDLLRSIYA